MKLRKTWTSVVLLGVMLGALIFALLQQKFVLALFIGALLLVDLFLLNLLRDERS